MEIENVNITVRENLFIRTPVLDDAPQIFNTIDKNRTYLRKWLPWVDETDKVEVTSGIVEKWQQRLKDGTDAVTAIFFDGCYVGNMGVHSIDLSNNSAMIGYWLAEQYQGRGIMTDCVKALTNYCFDTLNLNRVYICCAEGNKKSRAIPERLNYIQEGILQDGICLYGEYHNEVVYGTVKRNRILP